MNTKVEILSQLIRDRRSIFTERYIQKEIAENDIRLILENANYAPTHKMSQPWRFKVFRKAAKTRLGEALAHIYKTQTPAEKFLQKKYDSFTIKTTKADTIIAICIQFHPEKVTEWEEVAAVACAVQNMYLTAESLGIGCYWGTPGPIKFLDKFLDLAPNEKCYGLFFMGYYDGETKALHRSAIEEKTTWIEE